MTGSLSKYLEITFPTSCDAKASKAKAIMYAELAETDVLWEGAPNLQPLAGRIIEKFRLPQLLQASAWETDNPTLRIVNEGVAYITSTTPTLETIDGGKAWLLRR